MGVVLLFAAASVVSGLSTGTASAPLKLAGDFGPSVGTRVSARLQLAEVHMPGRPRAEAQQVVQTLHRSWLRCHSMLPPALRQQLKRLDARPFPLTVEMDVLASGGIGAVRVSQEGGAPFAKCMQEAAAGVRLTSSEASTAFRASFQVRPFRGRHAAPVKNPLSTVDLTSLTAASLSGKKPPEPKPEPPLPMPLPSRADGPDVYKVRLQGLRCPAGMARTSKEVVCHGAGWSEVEVPANAVTLGRRPTRSDARHRWKMLLRHCVRDMAPALERCRSVRAVFGRGLFSTTP